MESIFHEKQEGSLCAQHCLNALLQGSFFTAVDLAEIARQLDEKECATMAEAGTFTEEYRRFKEQPSSNYDDSGFFSIQVIDNAVEVWNLTLKPLKSSDAEAVLARRDPRSQNVYICNFREHWFCIRKIGHQWFNLNSLLSGPELLSETFLQLFLKQLETEGYSIFIVVGAMPECEADAVLRLCPAVQPIKPTLLSGPETSKGQFDNNDLQKALAESQQCLDTEDPTLQEALKMSLEGIQFDGIGVMLQPESSASSSKVLSPEELRIKRLNFLDGKNRPTDSMDQVKSSPDISPAEMESVVKADEKTEVAIINGELSEEAMLQLAVEMSMSTENNT